ncbi:imidazoleglycerol-phosphate dehydratase HisB [Halothermothrix orenii]|uniref:Imidazoleglycerol-phosphate dehydratase n=1 Tax=Halothermothrix orenii (strain H 168 / OCM 544 / DSM 9562) TaxID=373903 RepID=B8D113_HALOH|nr:imidazoleglycerol-phosphate dehydratase HisB [Halothermothrix orenii]ACL68982.1 Imidazoleglycerol-phosphate dehydratase [Halothermothrix orenii H 168]
MVEITRKTKETKIKLNLDLDGQGRAKINTGIGFFDHMLELWAVHGFFDLVLSVEGDLEVDGHHTVEDTGIVLGEGLKKALGNKAGLKRYGNVIIPMDESLVLVSLDLSGRPYYEDDLVFNRTQVGGFPVELLEEFFRALTNNAGITLHIKMLRGKNTHHLIEACFKGFGRALDVALTGEERLNNTPLSSKGSLGEGG